MLAELDQKDRSILFELDMGSRQSYSQISRRVGLSKQSVEYRIRNLIDKGIIKGFYAVLDTSKLGFLQSRGYLQFYGISPQKELELINYLTTLREVGEVTSTDGSWDLSFVLWADSVPKLSKAVDDITYKYGSLIKKKEVSLSIEQHFFQHKYLLSPAKEGKTYTLFSDVTHEYIDDLDYRILSLIAVDSRMPLISVANKLGCSYKVIAYRLRRLERLGVIAAYRTDIDYNTLRHTHYKVFLILHNNSLEREEALLQFLAVHPHIISASKTLGTSDLQFECIMPASVEFYNLMRELRSKFYDIVQEHSTVTISEKHQANYLPTDRPAPSRLKRPTT